MFVKVNVILLLATVASVLQHASPSVTMSMQRMREAVINEKHLLTEINKTLKPYFKKVDANLKHAFLSFCKQRIKDINARNVTRELERLYHPNGAHHLIHEYVQEYDPLWQILIAVEEKNLQIKLASFHKIFKDTDLTGAAHGLLRLQHVYGLKITDMIRGRFLQFQGPPLNSSDAVVIGIEAFNVKLYEYSFEWLEASLRLMSVESKSRERNDDGGSDDGDDDEEDGDKLDVLDQADDVAIPKFRNKILAVHLLTHLGLSLARLGNKTRAERFYREAMKYAPNHKAVLELKAELSKIEPPVVNSVKKKNSFSLCLKEKHTKNLADRRLHCRYRGVYLPYYRFREEIVLATPYITLFYDVISDSEAQYLKSVSSDLLHEGSVKGPDGKMAVYRTIRTTQLAFMEDRSFPVVKLVSERIGQLTGLRIEERPGGYDRERPNFAEPLQVANYGFAGHYVRHLDAGSSNADPNIDDDDRLATFLIYLSDVEAGGNTVFPELNISVKPVQGKAIFWYNFSPSGDLERTTVHWACPVITGDKWIATKWIYILGNAFNRRCGLTKEATQLDIEADMTRGYRPE